MAVRLTCTDNATGHDGLRWRMGADAQSVTTVVGETAPGVGEVVVNNPIEPEACFSVAAYSGEAESDATSICSATSVPIMPSIFSGTQIGAAFDFTDESTVYRDAFINNAVPGVDNIAAVRDLSGNDLHMVENQRQTDGGLPAYIEGSQSSYAAWNRSSLAIPSAGIFAGNAHKVIGVNFENFLSSDSNAGIISVDRSETEISFYRAQWRYAKGIRLRRQDSDSLFSGEFSSLATFPTSGGSVVIIINQDIGEVRWYFNGVLEDTISVPSGPVADSPSGWLYMGLATNEAADAAFGAKKMFIQGQDSAYSESQISEMFDWLGL